MNYLEKILPSREKLLNLAAELGGKDAVAKPTEAALDSGGYKNVLIDVDQGKLSQTAKKGFTAGIVNFLKKRSGV